MLGAEDTEVNRIEVIPYGTVAGQTNSRVHTHTMIHCEEYYEGKH